jgi:hypothetical protein
MLLAALVNPNLIPIPYRIYQPKRAGNLPIPANPPVNINKWDATLVRMGCTFVNKTKEKVLYDVGLLWQIAGAISAFSQYPAGSWLKREYP